MTKATPPSPEAGTPAYTDGNIDNSLLNAVSGKLAELRDAEGLNTGDPVALTGVREKTHGDWAYQAHDAFMLKERLRCGNNWEHLAPYQKEALDMIAVKISRILTGDNLEPDHWDDIAGYAHLGKGGHAS